MSSSVSLLVNYSALAGRWCALSRAHTQPGAVNEANRSMLPFSTTQRRIKIWSMQALGRSLSHGDILYSIRRCPATEREELHVCGGLLFRLKKQKKSMRFCRELPCCGYPASLCRRLTWSAQCSISLAGARGLASRTTPPALTAWESKYVNMSTEGSRGILYHFNSRGYSTEF